jgi:hypothetical protein
MREFFIAMLVFASLALFAMLMVERSRLTADETQIKNLQTRADGLEARVNEFSRFRVDMKGLGVKLDRLQDLIKQEQAPAVSQISDQSQVPTGPVQ